MASRDVFIKPGLQNFPIIADIHEIVPFPIVTYADPAVGCEERNNTCRLVRDVTQSPPTFPTNPTCFTLPDQVKVADVFISAMKGTIGWNMISCKETNISNTTTKVGRTSYHNKIWRLVCPCAGSPRKPSSSPPESELTKQGLQVVTTTVNKDGTIDIQSKSVKAIQTITTTINGKLKKTTVETEITGEPLSQPTVAVTRKREPSTKCMCPAKFFIRRHINNSLHEVEWHWKHKNHNPFSLDDMKRMQASVPLKNWLSEKVLGGMTWPTLHKLLRNSDLTRVRSLPIA